MASSNGKPRKIDFFFDIMCPWAYQTSIWIREVRSQIDLDINWKFFSLEEINREEGKKHPWEREIAYGWTPLRIAAWLRRIDVGLCDDWYLAAAKALHEDGLRPYEEATARELLASIAAPENTWDEALADKTTHDDVRRDHEESVNKFAAFGVPLIVFENGRSVFGP
ncbi:MAG: DsbA family protein, partial [Acidimicrobiaceae bacterium]